MRKAAVFVISAVFILWPTALQASPERHKLFGVMDDGPHLAVSAELGFDVIKKTVWLSPTNWRVGHLHQGYLAQMDRDMAQARERGLKVILQLYMVREFHPPRGPNQQRGVCDVGVDLIERYPEVFGIEVGVEPNNYDFWKPQFALGKNVSAAPYTGWLATCYDKLKVVNPEVLVIGGSLASRGEDNPRKPRSSTSPTFFIKKMCEAYSYSARDRPLMDWFDMHSYQDGSPSTQHAGGTTITIGDYQKLNDLLACFEIKGHPRPAILWGESGYETLVPQDQQHRYKGEQPPMATALEESQQGNYIAEQIQMAYCQPNSVGYINFLLVDEQRLDGWQSGLSYPRMSNRPAGGDIRHYRWKQSLPIVRKALAAAQSGNLICG